MPRTELDRSAATAVIASSDVVRVAFLGDETAYLIPFGYAWMDSAFCGVTDPGKKTELAAVRPDVAFQVDTSSVSGIFEWESVTGEGRFEIVEDPVARGRIIASLEEFAATAPAWWRDEQLARVAAGHLLTWRLTPSTMTGVRYAPAAER